jgi:vacuolar-type H+-ATPase subunit C/Vma6
MIGAGEKAYAFTKSSGIIGKSFVGRRIAALNPVSRLSELDQLVFASAARELPERELLPDMERRLSARSVASIASVLKAFKKPPELFALLLRVYEYADLKTALTLIAEKETAVKPFFTPLGRFATVRFDLWPDAKAMLAGTDFQFMLPLLERAGAASSGGISGAGVSGSDVPGGIASGSALSGETGERKADAVSMETALDRHYYNKLWTSLGALNKKERGTSEKIIAEEIALRNCAWALRLRTYYGMKAEEAARYLIGIEKNVRGLRDAASLQDDALAALAFSLDNYSDWEHWKRVRFLNTESSGGQWRADPRYFQNAASEYLYRLALRNFRASLSFIDKIFCFIKLKQFEEDLLTSNAEGLGMGMTGKDVLALLEAVS